MPIGRAENKCKGWALVGIFAVIVPISTSNKSREIDLPGWHAQLGLSCHPLTKSFDFEVQPGVFVCPHAPWIQCAAYQFGVHSNLPRVTAILSAIGIIPLFPSDARSPSNPASTS